MFYSNGKIRVCFTVMEKYVYVLIRENIRTCSLNVDLGACYHMQFKCVSEGILAYAYAI